MRRPVNIPGEFKALDRRDLQLWGISFILITALALGFCLLHLSLPSEPTTYERTILYGQAVLILLTLAYLIQKEPKVLVIGVGGGQDIVQALGFGARSVTGVEINPSIDSLMRNEYAEHTGHLYERSGAEILVEEGRSFLRRSRELYDVIQMTGTDTYSALSSGSFILSESYLYTVEAFEDYLRHLSDHGLVSVIMGDPMFEGMAPLNTRLTLVAREALERMGVENPSDHLLNAAQVKGSMVVGNLLVKRSPFAPEEVARVERYLTTNDFRLLLGPGGKGDPDLVALVDS